MAIQIVLLLIQAMRLVALVAERIPKAREEFDQLTDSIEQMVKEGRNPTPQEFDAMMQQTESLRHRIMGEDLSPEAAEALRPLAAEGASQPDPVGAGTPEPEPDESGSTDSSGLPEPLTEW